MAAEDVWSSYPNATECEMTRLGSMKRCVGRIVHVHVHIHKGLAIGMPALGVLTPRPPPVQSRPKGPVEFGFARWVCARTEGSVDVWQSKARLSGRTAGLPCMGNLAWAVRGGRCHARLPSQLAGRAHDYRVRPLPFGERQLPLLLERQLQRRQPEAQRLSRPSKGHPNHVAACPLQMHDVLEKVSARSAAGFGTADNYERDGGRGLYCPSKGGGGCPEGGIHGPKTGRIPGQQPMFEIGNRPDSSAGIPCI
jgi:hypothetical protein